MHRHRDEDEYTYVLDRSDRRRHRGPARSKPARGTCCSSRAASGTRSGTPATSPPACLELISPAGLEELFRSFASIEGEPQPEQLAEMAAKFGCDIDFPATFPVVERHRLSL